MLDKFSPEINVCNQLRTYLEINNFEVIQLIFPGGQASFSIRYESPMLNVKKTIYPDLIAITESRIIIGEVKADFSTSDKQKLLDIAHSENGGQKIKQLVSRITKKDVTSFNIEFILIHGNLKCQKDNQIKQLIFEGKKVIEF